MIAIITMAVAAVVTVINDVVVATQRAAAPTFITSPVFTEREEQHMIDTHIQTLITRGEFSVDINI